jgi:hypothetical protein
MKTRIMAIMAVFSLMAAVSAHAGLNDNGNGTIIDTVQGLVWLKNANCFGTRHWPVAMADARSLQSGMCGLSDKSTAEQWRLPTKDELHAKFFTSKAGFTSIQPGNYWSGSTSPSSSEYVSPYAWSVNMSVGYMVTGSQAYEFYVWPVHAVQPADRSN